MGLLDMLTKGWTKNPQGSTYAAQPNGATPPTNPLSTKQSNLHYDVAKNDMGYSTVGANAGTVGTQYAQYRDGVVNPLPPSSLLEFADPTSTTIYGNKKGQNTYIGQLTENPAGVTE
jgi:hypothetical protein